MRQWINIIWPIAISSDTTSIRRAYLNRLTFSLDAPYGRLWLHYEKALRQRNILLQQGVTNPTWYKALEDFPTTHLGLGAHSQGPWGHVTPFPQPQCAMHGEAETSLSKDPSGAHYGEMLAQNRGQHRLQKTTSWGAQNTISVDPPQWPRMGGEHKGLLLSLALALFRLCLNDQPDVVHFLLLDEGMTHLDEHRAAWLWDELLVLAGGDVGCSGPGNGRAGMVVVTGTWGDAPACVAHWKSPPSV